MNAGLMRQWFKEGSSNIYDEPSGRPFLVSDDLVIDDIARENHRQSHLTVYCNTLRKIKRAIQRKSCGLLTSEIIFLHHIVCLHSAQRTQNLWRQLKWVVFIDLSDCPDLLYIIIIC
ncbi:hypothetical protein NPIL_243601 [Nephila pilipes]|uniref:Uncharacterized protein n=1 Tax=Nephila pilipes TaxID=299642 RepID=A0A8X6Q6T4_NEPPI|nr:hypothetical protein NPIL_243601 [Nephila pilipes]